MPEHGFPDQKRFLSKAWLVKLDNASDLSYLLKFDSSENQCCVLVTDTINVWYEVLDCKYLTRRWRTLNGSPLNISESDEEVTCRITRRLSEMHTPLAIQGSAFSVEESYEADLAIEIQILNIGKWRWECYKLGFKASAQLLSTHLFFPLLSIANLAFTSADSVSELSTPDLEEVVDNVAKAGRRTQGTFLRQTLSRPRIATTLARLSALLNFVDPVPPIQDDYDLTTDVDVTVSDGTRNFSIPGAETPSKPSFPPAPRSPSQDEAPQNRRKKSKSPLIQTGNESEESATEPESDVDQQTTDFSRTADPELSVTDALDDGLSAQPAAKKFKPSTDTNSQENRFRLNAQTPSGSVIRKIGVRQPVKRGGKRF